MRCLLRHPACPFPSGTPIRTTDGAWRPLANGDIAFNYRSPGDVAFLPNVIYTIRYQIASFRSVVISLTYGFSLGGRKNETLHAKLRKPALAGPYGLGSRSAIPPDAVKLV